LQRIIIHSSVLLGSARWWSECSKVESYGTVLCYWWLRQES